MPPVSRKNKIRSRSAYQSHTSTYGCDNSNVVDLSERKLARLAVNHRDEQIRELAAKMLRDYVDGRIAVAWEDGVVPVYCFLSERR